MKQLRDQGGEDAVENPKVCQDLLLPLARAVAVNWNEGNRLAAATELSHITGSGPEATALVSTLSKVLKKINHRRLLESHMVCLRNEYEHWLQMEPEELESERPTEEEMSKYEEAEKHFKEMVSSCLDCSRCR